MLPYETVVNGRTGLTVSALIDPHERRLYFDLGVDVQAGDTVGFRGYTRRLTVLPEVWATAGVVAVYEDSPVYLPDLGELSRPTGPGARDDTTGVRGPGSEDLVWSGPCLVEPAQADGTNPEIGDQQVGIVPFVVTVPLALTGVKVGDRMRITQSRDARLLVRTLVVKAVRASSSALTRDLLAFDNQGG
jgi:hypothetical protein